MISYGAERNICFRIFESKNNKALSLFIILTNHKSSGEGEILTPASKVPFRHHPLLDPSGTSGLVSTEMLGVLFKRPQETGLNFQPSWLKVLQMEQVGGGSTSTQRSQRRKLGRELAKHELGLNLLAQQPTKGKEK